MQLSDRIQSAVDAALFSFHKAKRDHDEAPSEEMALVYRQLDDACRQLKTLKAIVLQVEAKVAA